MTFIGDRYSIALRLLAIACISVGIVLCIIGVCCYNESFGQYTEAQKARGRFFYRKAPNSESYNATPDGIAEAEEDWFTAQEKLAYWANSGSFSLGLAGVSFGVGSILITFSMAPRKSPQARENANPL
jgi:hypothetical protein